MRCVRLFYVNSIQRVIPRCAWFILFLFLGLSQSAQVRNSGKVQALDMCTTICTCGCKYMHIYYRLVDMLVRHVHFSVSTLVFLSLHLSGM
jgi:hypothetical protein